MVPRGILLWKHCGVLELPSHPGCFGGIGIAGVFHPGCYGLYCVYRGVSLDAVGSVGSAKGYFALSIVVSIGSAKGYFTLDIVEYIESTKG